MTVVLIIRSRFAFYDDISFAHTLFIPFNMFAVGYVVEYRHVNPILYVTLFFAVAAGVHTISGTLIESGNGSLNCLPSRLSSDLVIHQ